MLLCLWSRLIRAQVNDLQAENAKLKAMVQSLQVRTKRTLVPSANHKHSSASQAEMKNLQAANVKDLELFKVTDQFHFRRLTLSSFS